MKSVEKSSPPNVRLARILATSEYSFSKQGRLPPLFVEAAGTLLNFNSEDKFKDSDKKALLLAAGEKLWQDMVTGNVFKVRGDACLLASQLATLRLSHKALTGFGIFCMAHLRRTRSCSALR